MDNRKLIVELEWDADNLGEGWMNIYNLELCLYSENHTKRELLSAKLLEPEEEPDWVGARHLNLDEVDEDIIDAYNNTEIPRDYNKLSEVPNIILKADRTRSVNFSLCPNCQDPVEVGKECDCTIPKPMRTIDSEIPTPSINPDRVQAIKQKVEEMVCAFCPLSDRCKRSTFSLCEHDYEEFIEQLLGQVSALPIEVELEKLPILDKDERLICSTISDYPLSKVEDVIKEASIHQRDNDFDSIVKQLARQGITVKEKKA